MNIVLFPFLIALFTAIILTPISIIFIKKIGLMDDPRLHKHPGKIHTKPIPRGGGIPFFLGIFLTSLIFFPINNLTIALFLSSFLALFIGVLDDKLDISPYIRFTINILCALIVVANGVSIPFITNPLGGILHLDTIKFSLPFLSNTVIDLSDAIALLWIVWVINMLNWSKGVDGQMPGIVAISAIVIGLLSLRFPIVDIHSLLATKLSFIIAGSALGFLIFNFYPAKIFPGYGATSVYLLLSVVSILSGVKLATAVLVMAVPMVDGVFTIGRRILNKKSPFWHDKKHLHHLLLSLGLGQRSIALFYWFISAIVGVISLTLSSRGKLFAILMVVILIGGGITFLHRLVRNRNET